MAFTDSGIYTSVDQTTGGQGPNKSTVKVPDATSNMTAVRALTNLSGTGVMSIEVDGNEYGIALFDLS